MLIIVVLIYSFAGLNKLLNSGLGWISNENMAVIILSRPSVTELGKCIGLSSWIPGVLALTTIFIQTSSITILFSRRMRFLILMSLCSMHIGTQLLMGAHGAFIPYSLCFILFLPILIPHSSSRL